MSRRSSLLVFGCVVGLGLQGCILISAVAGCSLESANQAGGSVTRVTEFTEAGAISLADEHCRHYGRVAQVTGLQLAASRLIFDCVAP